MDAAQWTSQVIGVVKEVEITRQSEKRLKACKDQSPNCPRCNSTNTKFCYYNNYSRTQPRYFCKTCRRYWTEGGSLRNVPVGGCSRKNKRSSLSSLANSSTSTTTSSTTTTSLVSSSMNLQPQFPLATTKLYQVAGQDLKFSFPTQQGLGHYDHVCGGGGGGSISGFEMLRSGISPKGFAPFAAAPGPVFGAEFGFQELTRQSNLKLPLDHHGGFSGSNIGRPLFPFEDLKQVHVSNGGHEEDENRVVQGEGGEGDLFWNGGNNGRGGGTW